MVNLKYVATNFAPMSAYDVLSMLISNCGAEAVRVAIDEIAAQSARAADTAPVKARVRKVIRPKILIDSDDLLRG